jgi:ribosome maturation factor RimP
VRPADFVRHRGRAIDVRTVEPFDGSRRLRGVLAAADAEGITVLPEGGSVAGVVPPAARRIRLGDVASARLVVDVPRPSRPGRPADKVRKR